MYKKILIGATLLLVVAVLVITATWFIHASAIKKDVVEKLALLNTENSNLSYEAITTSGFPSSMTVSIVKPHFTGRMDKIIAASDFQKMFNQGVLPEWNEDYLLDGNIEISVNAISNKFTLVSHGNWIGKGSIGGQPISLTSESSGDSICELQMKHGNGIFGNLWNFYSLMNIHETFAHDFRSFDCYNSGGKVINGDTKEVVISNGPVRFHIDHTPNGNLSSGRFYLLSTDLEATKASDAIYTIYYKMLAPKLQASLPSVYGKQNVEIDMSYNGPNDFKNQDVKKLPLDISINKFHLASNASISDITLRVTSDIKNDARTASLAYKSEFTATELFQALLKQELNAIVNSVISGATPANPGIREKLASMPPESIESLIVTIIPNLAAQGKMVTRVEASYNGDENFTSGQATLNALELSSALYGITASGSAKRDKSSPMPSGSMAILCNNCFKMIDDGIGYFNRIRYAISVLQPGKVSNVNFPPETVQGIKNFLIALNPNAGNTGIIKFDIINNGSGATTVNGRSMAEVISLFSQNVTSTINKK
jgi:hypothetical protein